MKINVKPEGREGVWIPNKDSLVDFLINYPDDEIHHYFAGRIMIGADHTKESVVDDVKEADRLAILTGDALSSNLRHALSVITNNKLSMFDIGEIKESDLNVVG